MRIGVVGLGKLGMPVALAISLKGHDVMGYDIDPARMQKHHWPYMEAGPEGHPHMLPLLQESDLQFGDLGAVVEHAQIVFVVVQTPHGPEYEGVTRLPETRADFDYSHLVSAVHAIREEAQALEQHVVCAIISTVLPGTIRREILPIAGQYLHVCHTPFFEAMGTVVRNFFDREFALCGTEDPMAARAMTRFYATVTDAPQLIVSIEDAEAIKVFYNTFASLKVVFANTVMEACHKVGANVDHVTGALKLATQRLISPMYLSGGMGDGGVCHPRDNIALSWFAREHDLSFDLFEAVMMARERQAEWLADLMCEYDLPKAMLGKSFKKGSNITTGSACMLVKHLLEERGESVVAYDPYVDDWDADDYITFEQPAVFLHAMNHDQFKRTRFAPGSVVIDVWRDLPHQEGVTYVPVGACA